MENIKVIEIDTSKSINSVKDLRKAIKELLDGFVAGKLSEEEFRELLDPLTDSLVKMTNATNDSRMASNDLGVVLKNVSTSLSAGMAAVQGVSAALNLMGIESEDAVKAILKMLNIMALSDAFSKLADDGPKAFKALSGAIKTATKGLKGFKLALVSTGIGAIVVLVGALIANFDKLKAALEPGLSEKLAGVKAAFTSFGDSIKSVGKIIGTVVKTYIGTLVTAVTGIGTVLKNFFTGDWSGAVEAGKETALKIRDGIKDGADLVVDEGKAMGKNVANAYNQGVAEQRAKNAAEAKKIRDAEWAEQRKGLEKNLQLEAKLKESYEKEGWKYTEEGKQYYDNYFNTRLSWYSKDSDEYKNILIEKNNYDKLYTAQYQSELDAQAAAREEANRQKRELAAKDYEEIGRILDELATKQNDNQTNELNKLTDDYETKKALFEKYGQDITALTEDYNRQLAEIRQKYADEEVKLKEELIQKENEGRQNQINQLQLDYDYEHQLLLNKLLNGEISQLEYDVRALELSTNALNDRISKLQQQLEAENLSKDERLRILEELNTAQQLQADLETARRKLVTETTMMFANLAANSAISILNSLADAQDKDSKEGFERSKKLQIASATILMLSGIAAAFASAMTVPPPVGPIVAAINAATVATTGALLIAKIKKTKFNASGTSSSSSGGTSSAASSTPSFNASSVLSDLTLSTRNVVSDSELIEEMKNTKVYVTETDISNTTNNVKTQVSENTF